MQSSESEDLLPEKVIAPPKKEVVLAPETEPGISRTTIVTAVSVFAFSFLLILLFMAQRSSWNQKIEAGLVLARKAELSERAAVLEVQNLLLLDSQRLKFFHNHYFDANEESKFQIYGTFYDKEKKYSAALIARRFNISSAAAITERNAGDERRFIVPVKAVHFVRSGETAEILAKKYYFNHKEAAALIREFNPSIRPGKAIFIPFN